MNAHPREPERLLLDEALFEDGPLLPDPMADVSAEALMETATAALPEPMFLPPMQVVFSPLVQPASYAWLEEPVEPDAPARDHQEPDAPARDHQEPDAPAREDIALAGASGSAPRPLRLAVLTELTLKQGDTATLTPEYLAITGADSPFHIAILLLSAPVHGTLLRDGFALTGGDVFTQEDLDQGRVRYRHDGACGEDSFTFATPEGEVPPTAFRLTVVPTRRAPELTQARRLWGIQQSCKIADILAGAVCCHEPGVEPGMAVVAAAGRGDWAYSSDGETWQPLGEVHPGNVLLLEPTHAIRFVPVAGWSGHAKLTYRAWDRSRHEASQRLDLSPLDSVGGATAFSSEVTVATAVIRATTGEGGVEPWLGQPTARELVGGGMAVVRLEGRGVWQYSLDDGKTWLDFAAVYHGKALLLRGEDRVRFLPNKAGTGKVQFRARLWDGRDGAAGEIVNLSCHGATGDGTPFSEFVQTRTWRLGVD